LGKQVGRYLGDLRIDIVHVLIPKQLLRAFPEKAESGIPIPARI
jgi:hypothetical protein